MKFYCLASFLVTASTFLIDDDLCYHSSVSSFLATLGYDRHIGGPFGLPDDKHHARRATDMINKYPTDTGGCHPSTSTQKCYMFRVQYDKDSQSGIGRDDGRKGAQFFTQIPHGGATDVTLEYQVYIPKTLVWDKHGTYTQIGGKLPGLYGGAPICSGGRSGDDNHCFSTRYMWRDGGRAELYLYFPKKAQTGGFSSWRSKHQSNDHVTITEHVSHSDSSKVYGTTVRTDSFRLHHCHWHTLKQHIHINDVGDDNGWIDVYLDGTRMFHLSGVTFRTRPSETVEGIFFSTFFGGHDSTYASQHDTFTLYKNFKLSYH